MALPLKKVKLNVNIDPPKIGTKYLKYGMDRIEELMIKTDKKSNYLPRSIHLDDVDNAISEYVTNGNLKLVLDNKDVPTFYLENSRWGEFSKTWKFMDGDKNVPTPYITIRRIDKDKGTRLNRKSRVAQGKLFRYLEIPILDDGQVIGLLFKIPEPTNVDLTYEIRLFTKYRVDVNEYDEQILKNFASIQGYIWVKGTPFPVLLERIQEANTIENIDGDRFYAAIYAIKTLAYIQDEKEFVIAKTSRRPRININYERVNIHSKKVKNIKMSTISDTYRISVTYYISNHFVDINQMISNIHKLESSAIYYVSDGSADPNILSGYAYYEFTGYEFGDIRDFKLISSENALAQLILKTYTWIATDNQTTYVITTAKENEIFEIDDFLVGGLTQMNNTSISSTNVTSDTVVLDLGGDAIIADTEVYLQYLSKMIK